MFPSGDTGFSRDLDSGVSLFSSGVRNGEGIPMSSSGVLLSVRFGYLPVSFGDGNITRLSWKVGLFESSRRILSEASRFMARHDS